MKREEKNQQTRRRIMDSALAEFAANGYGGSSVNTICAAQGISKGIVYHYFESKDELYLACVEECFQCLTAHLSAALPEEDAALLESPNNILGIEYCKALLGQNATLRAVTIRREGSAHDGTLAPDTHPSASGLRALLRQGKREEALSLLPPAMARAYEL